MVKKTNKKQQKVIEFQKNHVVIKKTPAVLLGASLLAVAAVLAVAFSVYKYSVTANNQARLSQIKEIYSSLQLGIDYRETKANIFGDKRVYEWDRGRTFASEVQFAHPSAPPEVRAELRKKVEAAGFTYVQTEYEGSIQPIDQFKNSKGNYVRVAVMSKYVQDKFTYGDYDLSDPLVDHKDEAPSYVSLKVNLDDNNE